MEHICRHFSQNFGFQAHVALHFADPGYNGLLSASYGQQYKVICIKDFLSLLITVYSCYHIPLQHVDIDICIVHSFLLKLNELSL